MSVLYVRVSVCSLVSNIIANIRHQTSHVVPWLINLCIRCGARSMLLLVSYFGQMLGLHFSVILQTDYCLRLAASKVKSTITVFTDEPRFAVCTICGGLKVRQLAAILSVFTARRYASAVYAMALCSSVCPSVCVCLWLSQIDVLLKRIKDHTKKTTR